MSLRINVLAGVLPESDDVFEVEAYSGESASDFCSSWMREEFAFGSAEFAIGRLGR